MSNAKLDGVTSFEHICCVWVAIISFASTFSAAELKYSDLLRADAHSFDYMLVHSQEAKRFDPDGNYVRRWLPVLGRMPAKWIHRCNPLRAPASTSVACHAMLHTVVQGKSLSCQARQRKTKEAQVRGK